MSAWFARMASWAIARRGAVVAASVFVTLLGAASALRLDTEAGTSTLVGGDSEAAAATDRFHELFGDEAIAILVQGDLQQLVLTENLGQLLRLEGCLAGNLPKGEPPAAPACAELAQSDPVRVVYGPATFLNQSAIQAGKLLNRQIEDARQRARAAAAQAAAAARRQGLSEQEQRADAIAAAQGVLNSFYGQLQELAVRYGQTGPPTLDDPRFVRAVVFDSRLPDTPKARFSYLFPSAQSALISVRLEPGLSGEERANAIGLIRDAVADPEFHLHGGSYVVSGVPVVVEELADEFQGELFVLFAAALAVMAIVLMLVFGPPLRLLPLALALIATAIAFGVLSLAGGSLTMASIAVLPVLIGLSVDYAIQFQARYRESAQAGEPPAAAARLAATRGGPIIATAALATGAGFLVLLLSPIPMVRGFGILLVVGIAAALLAALTTGIAALSAVRPPSGPPRGPRLAPPRALQGLAGRLGSAREAVSAPLRRLGKAALATSISAPGRVLAVAAVLAVAGWVAGTRTEVVSDLRELVPGQVLADAGVDELQSETGVSGELNVIVDAPDITDPQLIAWMSDLKARILARGGFSGEFPSCEDARICPQVSLSDLFGEQGTAPTQGEVRTLLKAVPAYFSQAVVARDTGPDGGDTANIAFGIRVMPLDEQKELIDGVRAELDPPGTEHDPPPGVEAHVAGLPVLAADANAELSQSRYWLTLAGLIAVALVLIAVYRSVRRALVPLVPIVMATGWSALVLALTGIPLNPMSATLGALVIAIATEFSVILSARYGEERAGGRSVGEALRLTYARTGAAVLASGVTAIAGFAVLMLSGIKMLRDFGVVTVLDLGVALVGVMLVLPAALVWAESGKARAAAPGRLRRRVAALVPGGPARRGARGG